jgi:hypothetical protein
MREAEESIKSLKRQLVEVESELERSIMSITYQPVPVIITTLFVLYSKNVDQNFISNIWNRELSTSVQI